MLANGEKSRSSTPSSSSSQLRTSDVSTAIAAAEIGLNSPATSNNLNTELFGSIPSSLLTAPTAAGTAGPLYSLNALAAAGIAVPQMNDMVAAMNNNGELLSAYLQMLNQTQNNHQTFIQQYNNAVAQQRIQQVNNVRQQRQPGRSTKEKKRSYPCSFQYCEICRKYVHSSKLPCHIRQVHVAQAMFLCPRCEFSSTYSKNNVKSHMVSLHGLAEEPISHMEKYAELVEHYMRQCFPSVRGRGRPIHGNVRRSPISPSSQKSTESNNSRRGSTFSMLSTSGNGIRYTHSHRRKGGKHAAQEPVCASNNPKRVKNEDEHQNDLAVDSQVSASTSNHSSLIEEGISHNINNCHIGENGIIAMDSENSSSSSEQANQDVELDFDDADQPLRHGENIKPRYLPQHTDWQILTENQVKGTIFEAFQPSEILDKFKRQPFDVLAGNAAFATEEQLRRVEEVREQITLDMSKLRDALNSLDVSLLSTEHVDLIASIAPSSVDINRLLNYERADPAAVAGENEKFLIMLAKIDRLEEKLHAMSFLGHFRNRIKELMKCLNDFNSAAKVLRENEGFHALLQIVVVYSNFIVGDFKAEALRGFRVSALMGMCSVELCSSPKITLLSVIASTIAEHFPEVGKFRETLPALEKVARVNFQELATAIRRFEKDYLRFFLETSHLNDRRRVRRYKDTVERKLRELHSSYYECKIALSITMRFLGEPVNEDDDPESPEVFFASIAAFFRRLQMACLDVHLQAQPDQQVAKQNSCA